jgi:hypothetical protein
MATPTRQLFLNGRWDDVPEESVGRVQSRTGYPNERDNVLFCAKHNPVFSSIREQVHSKVGRV